MHLSLSYLGMKFTTQTNTWLSLKRMFKSLNIPSCVFCIVIHFIGILADPIPPPPRPVLLLRLRLPPVRMKSSSKNKQRIQHKLNSVYVLSKLGNPFFTPILDCSTKSETKRQ